MNITEYNASTLRILSDRTTESVRWLDFRCTNEDGRMVAFTCFFNTESGLEDSLKQLRQDIDNALGDHAETIGVPV